jgi:hypothetical protein
MINPSNIMSTSTTHIDQYENHDQYENTDSFDSDSIDSDIFILITIFILIPINDINRDVEMIRIIKAATCEGRWRGFRRVESNDWRGKIAHGFRRIQSETTVRQKMGRTLW